MPPADPTTPLVSRPAAALRGTANPPGDKSISHRALILGAMAVGETEIEGLLGADDVTATGRALEALGARIDGLGAGGAVRVAGAGVGGLTEPGRALDLGNSGTGVRLLMGAVASHDLRATFTGDASLSRRPMGRVMAPLAEMGAQFTARGDDYLPLTVDGAAEPVPIEYELPVASAQVKSAILLAALNTPGVTSVIEPAPTRDHTEAMLRHFGADISVDDTAVGRLIALVGYPELDACRVEVPADPSAAAFPAVAALVAAGSELTLAGVGLNPLRAGLYVSLREMGAEIEERDPRDQGGEPVADLVVRAGPLKAISVPAGRAPSMIDEYPALAVAAAYAEGVSVFEGIGELRVKESDRLAAIAAGLKACGVKVEAGEDRLAVHGCGGPPPGQKKGAPPIATHGDHRIAMAFLSLGVAARNPVAVDGAEMISTSFPDFAGFMNALGADIGLAEA